MVMSGPAFASSIELNAEVIKRLELEIREQTEQRPARLQRARQGCSTMWTRLKNKPRLPDLKNRPPKRTILAARHPLTGPRFESAIKPKRKPK